jgi:N-acetyl-gamma-glutamyl-phosphate reductase
MVDIGIIGATGYTGLELLRLLQRHPHARIAWLTSESAGGQHLGDVFALPPVLGAHTLLSLDQADLAIDLVFCCLPHLAAQVPVAAARASGARVVDISADYRLRDATSYEKWYGHPHAYPELLSEAAYGLPELHREEIAQASLVANPGCYPTSIILGLAPLARAGWLSGTVIADSKSGVSGAGRKPTLKTHFVEANENLSPYSIGRSHRHLAEMEQEIGRLVDWETGDRGLGSGELVDKGTSRQGSRRGWQIVFSPHLVPVNRGIVSTIYVRLPDEVAEAEVRGQYSAMYGQEPFVYVLPPGQVATLGHTVGTNYCAIGLTWVEAARTLIVTASIDNLIKGASGQAVQNMNVMYGWDEKTGLT